MATIKLIVTGDMEKLALHESLRRVFPEHRDGDEVLWDVPQKVAGATSHRLSCDDPPSRSMLALAGAMLQAVGIGKRGQPADLVVVIDDVELGNVDQEGVVVQCFRNAVRAKLDAHVTSEAPTRPRHEEWLALLRERCSFHLLRPMVESYLFGDTHALACAGVPAGTSPRLARSDVEDFETQDPDPAWQQRYRDENARTQPKLPWWRTECHPKRYLEHLTRHGVFYEETFHGRAALAELRWKQVLRAPRETRIARSLFEDLAEWFEIDNPVGEGSCHDDLFPDRRIDRNTLLLRNI